MPDNNVIKFPGADRTADEMVPSAPGDEKLPEDQRLKMLTFMERIFKRIKDGDVTALSICMLNSPVNSANSDWSVFIARDVYSVRPLIGCMESQKDYLIGLETDNDPPGGHDIELGDPEAFDESDPDE